MGLEVEMVDTKCRKPKGTANLSHVFLPQSLRCFFKLRAVFPPTRGLCLVAPGCLPEADKHLRAPGPVGT